VFRWCAWIWMAIVAVIERNHIDHPLPAILLIGAALLVTMSYSVLLAIRPGSSVHPVAVVIELLVGAALLVGGAFVQDGGQSQSLGSAWPLVGPLAAGLVFGPQIGLGAGLGLGVARGLSGMLGGRSVSSVSVLSSAVLYGLAGGVWGWVAARLRRSARTVALLAEVESSLAVARERENVARTLHDGVLQTLAVVQRRSSDPDLAALARRQELELRAYLFGREPAVDLVASLREVAARHEEVMGTRVTVVCPDDLGHVGSELIEAMRGAVTEALTNAAKHGRATNVTIFVEGTDGGVFVSVKDDGVGFDPDATDDGVGLARSIRARMREIGGRVEVESRPGSGAEVRLWGN
jgi:signal transduction histidine kinase